MATDSTPTRKITSRPMPKFPPRHPIGPMTQMGAVADPHRRRPAGHKVAAAQMRAFGGMVSFTVRGREQAAVELCSRTRIFTLAESLGAVESLIEHPGRMTRASTSGTTNEVPADPVRLSVELETIDDLLHDLGHALTNLPSG